MLFILNPPRRVMAGRYIEVDSAVLHSNLEQLKTLKHNGQIIVRTLDGRELDLQTLVPIPLPGSPPPVKVDERHFPLDKPVTHTSDVVEGRVPATTVEAPPSEPATDSSFENAFDGPATDLVNSVEELEESAADDINSMTEDELEAKTAPTPRGEATIKRRRGKLWPLRAYQELPLPLRRSSPMFVYICVTIQS